jgi:hypothetical protein
LLSALLQTHLKSHPNNQDQLLDILDNYLMEQKHGEAGKIFYIYNNFRNPCSSVYHAFFYDP